MFLPVASPSILRHFFFYFSKVVVSALVQDRKTTLATPQAKFLKNQFSYNRFFFQFIWIQNFNLTLFLTLDNISFSRWVHATCAE